VTALTTLQHIDNAETLESVFEAQTRIDFLHLYVQDSFSGMSERRMAEIVRQCDGFDQVFVESECIGH